MKEIQLKYINSSQVIDYYFVTFDENISENVLIKENIIYVKGKEMWVTILQKTIVAFDYLINKLNKSYDFIVRTNVSTMFNYSLLVSYLNSIRKYNVYIGGNDVFIELA